MDSTEDTSARARRLGRLIRIHRDELGISQAQLAERAKIHVNTMGRLETGLTRQRQSGTWTKLEVALEWPQGFIADFLAGEVDEVALAGKLRRDPVPEGDLTGMIHDMVLEVFGFAAPDVTLAQLRESERIALEVAKKHGYVPPLRQPEASEDQSGEAADGK